MSERRACTVTAVDRTMIRYHSVRPDDSALRDRLRGLAQVMPRTGQAMVRGIDMKRTKTCRRVFYNPLMFNECDGRGAA